MTCSLMFFQQFYQRETHHASLPGGLCSLRITSDAGVGLRFLICEKIKGPAKVNDGHTRLQVTLRLVKLFRPHLFPTYKSKYLRVHSMCFTNFILSTRKLDSRTVRYHFFFLPKATFPHTQKIVVYHQMMPLKINTH